MLGYLSYLSNPFVLAVIAGVLLMCVLYFDDKYNDNETDFKDYLKLFVAGTGVTGTMLFAQKLNLGQMFGGGGSFSKVKDVDFEGLNTGIPDF